MSNITPATANVEELERAVEAQRAALLQTTGNARTSLTSSARPKSLADVLLQSVQTAVFGKQSEPLATLASATLLVDFAKRVFRKGEPPQQQANAPAAAARQADPEQLSAGNSRSLAAMVGNILDVAPLLAIGTAAGYLIGARLPKAKMKAGVRREGRQDHTDTLSESSRDHPANSTTGNANGLIAVALLALAVDIVIGRRDQESD